MAEERSSGQKDKGKGKAPAAQSDGSSQQPSLASRIGSSATGLMKDAFAGTSASETLAANLASSEKVRSNQSGAGNNEASLARADQRIATTSGPNVSSRPSETFRSSSSAVVDTDAEMADFLQSRPQTGDFNELTPRRMSQYELAVKALKAGERAQPVNAAAVLHDDMMVSGGLDTRTSDAAAWIDEFRSQRGGNVHEDPIHKKTVQDAELTDGHDVVALLMQPGGSESWEDVAGANAPTNDSREMTEDDLADLGFTSTSEATAEPIASNQRDTTFMPDIGMIQPSLLPRADEGMRDVLDREEFIRHWDKVLNSYIESVWGDSLPRVQEAKKEIKSLTEHSDETADEGSSKSVRRLQQIVKQIKMPP